MKAKLIRHGVKYFIMHGVYCPDCDEIDFRIDKTGLLDVTPIGGPPEYIYQFICNKCSCVFTTTEDK